MSKFDSPLTNIHIASPCSTSWDDMYGDDRKRFCGDCELNVYNLSGMTQAEAEAVVMNAEGRLCVRFYQRSDGSIITTDCPIGWAKLKHKTRLYAAAMASLLVALFTGVLFVSLFSRPKTIVGKLIPVATPTPYYEALMGAVAAPPKNTNSNTNTEPKPRTVMGNVAVPPTQKNDSGFKMGKMKVMAVEEGLRRIS